ncbi:MAG: aldo/keto reductase [Synergistaceae bacterium]|nr:aldo/keto reductase [Synergistaceae bacterium]
MEKIKLNNGLEFPKIGFGTYKSETSAILLAIEAGYRYFDTASFYGTEGNIAEAIKQSGIKREDFFIASKLWKADLGYEKTKIAFEKTLESLKSDYVDVFMIHWPRPDIDNREEWREIDLETWQALEEFYEKKQIHALGFSNFLPYHAENIIKNSKILPAVAQLEFHPGYTQAFALNYYREKKILVQAWSPIARGRVNDDELIIELSKKYNVTAAQICLRFCIQENVMPLPKASSMERLKENLEVLNFEISPEDMSRIENMPPLGWSGEHPDRVRIKI